MRQSAFVLTLLTLLGCRPSPAAPAPPEPAPAPHEHASATQPAEPEAAAAIPTRPEVIGELTMDVPEPWIRSPPKNSLRQAEFSLPGEGEPVDLVVFRFPGGAGGTTANLERWRSQIVGADAPASTMSVGPLTITTLDLSGTYVAAIQPGSPQQHHEPNVRMLTAVVEGQGDPYYFKCVGPAASVDPWAEAIMAALESLRPTTSSGPATARSEIFRPEG